MKVVSTKKGSSRERVDADVILLPIANWRWVDGARHLVVSQQWGTGERSADLWLTEKEALGITKAVSEYLLSEQLDRLSKKEAASS